jgi:hypothetical protein
MIDTTYPWVLTYFVLSKLSLSVLYYFYPARNLAGGLRSNLLVPYEAANARMFDYIGGRNSSQGILNKKVVCNFYNQSRFAFRTLSAAVTVEKGSVLADIGPVQITCPGVMPMQSPITGEKLWDSVSIERSIEPLKTPVICFLAYSLKVFKSMTLLECRYYYYYYYYYQPSL